jgi:adenylate cyclase class 2
MTVYDRPMARSKREVEIKLPFDSPARAIDNIEKLGATLVRERLFEDNLLFERQHDPLKAANRLLRLRREGASALLTFKSTPPGELAYKVRLEDESVVDDPDAIERILLGLGFRPAYRYQKYRTLYQLDDLEICLDETPVGCYVELEGPPTLIDRTAAQLGFTPDRYILDSYRDIHQQHARERGVAPGDMLFDSEAGPRG